MHTRESNKKLFLLDAFALIYRAHFAFINRPLINSKGVNTSAITGFVNVLWDVIKNEKPTHLAVCFDLKGPTFRHEMFEPYKANRDEQPEDITIAIPWIEKILDGFNIPRLSAVGYEADDVVGTLATQAAKEGFLVYMMTPDKDYAQLVADQIFMYKPGRSGQEVEILGIPEVKEKFGIADVALVKDMLGLQGDSSDNIPGVPGVGPKTAQKLLAEFGSLEGILANTDQLKGKQKEKLEEFADQGRLSKDLATIRVDIPFDFDENQLKLQDFDRAQLSAVFNELEFRSIAKRILGGGEAKQGELFASAAKDDDSPDPIPAIADRNIENTPHDYVLVDKLEDMQALANKLIKSKAVCYDTETTGIDANEAELVGLSFALEPGFAWYVPVPSPGEESKKIIDIFKPVLENPKSIKIGQNIKYDNLLMKWHGVEVEGKMFDTMIAHYLLEPELRHNMNYLAESYLNYSPVSIETLIGKKGKNQLTMRQVPIEKAARYAAEDADVTLQLKDLLEGRLKKEKLVDLYESMEAPLVEVLTEMEYNGIKLDSQFLEDYSKTITKDILALRDTIYKTAGQEFNVDSPKQVGEMLFDTLKLPYRWKKTARGQYATGEEKLSELAEKHPIAKDILSYRALTKLKSTYVDALPKMVNPKSGRIHSSFNQALAATGRLSSNNPNLQNIPIKTEQGREVRKAFVPTDKNHVLLAADYSQIELRLIAELSGDKSMLEAFQKGLDIHTATASKVYGVKLEDVTPDQRRNAKTVNFSIIYGAGATNLSQQLNIPRKEAKELIEAYFKEYNGLRTYMNEVVEDARKTGHVKTLMGRRRKLRDINSANGFIRSNAERVAINTPIQGSAADMIKLAMIRIHEVLKPYKTKMVLQVHDELVFDVPKSELKEVIPIIEKHMKEAMSGLKVPIEVGIGTGANWLEAH